MLKGSALSYSFREGRERESDRNVFKYISSHDYFYDMTNAGSKKVIVCSGHMIDLPGRASPRFPPEKEGAVRAAMAAVLDAWRIGENSLAICGGARGADILFAELCLERNADVRLYLALPIPEFLERSVRIPGGDWEERFHRLLFRCDVRVQDKVPSEADGVFERANRWMLAEAAREAEDGKPRALLVWDEDPKTGKTGGTAQFFQELRKISSETSVINPAKIEGPALSR